MTASPETSPPLLNFNRAHLASAQVDAPIVLEGRWIDARLAVVRRALPNRIWPRVALLIAAAITLALWGLRVRSMVAQSGLFAAVGFDLGMYLAQAAAMRAGDATSLYRLVDLDPYHQSLAAYALTGAPLPNGPVPYPPLFAWLLQPLALIPPPIALLLWTGLNVVALLVLAWQIGRLVPRPQRRWLAVLFVLVFPGVIPSLILGQPMLLLACAAAEFYLCLRAGRDMRAGLWLACLFFKPHYGLLAGVLLLWKRRWSAVAGAALGVSVILIGSLLVAGVPALLAYPSSLADTADFRSAPTNPIDMINWRSLVLVAQILMPNIGDRIGLLLVAGLGIATVGLFGRVWHGRWDPSDSLWPARMAALWMVTLLANYHSHIYGLVLFVAPLAAAFASPGLSRRTRVILGAGLALPALIEPALMSVPAWRHLPSWLLAACLAIGLASLALDIWLAERRRGPGRQGMLRLAEASPERLPLAAS